MMNCMSSDRRMLPAWIVVGVTLAVTMARADDWPNFRGPNHDGTSSERITATWPLEVLWTKSVGDGWVETAVSGYLLKLWRSGRPSWN